MKYEMIHKKFSGPIAMIARKNKVYSTYIDEKDISQEMRLHLWEEWKNGALENKTDSYIIQNLWFHSKNYIRKNREKRKTVSLYEEAGDDNCVLENIIPNNLPPVDEIVENNILIQKIKNNGLTDKEKEILHLRLEGYNLREIGKRAGMSHVRVYKVLSLIIRKGLEK